MIKDLVNFLGEENYSVLVDESAGNVKVMEKVNGTVNQEIVFVLVANRQKYEILKVSRGSEDKIVALDDKKMALFYLGVKVKMSRLSTLFPTPEISDIQNEKDVEDALSIFLDHSLYSIGEYKKDAVCLFKGKSMYIVGYCDLAMKFHMISDDNPDLAIGTKVLVNFTWRYMYFKKFTKELNMKIDYMTQDYIDILQDVLHLKD